LLVLSDLQGAAVSIWKQTPTIERLTSSHVNTAAASLGIEFLEARTRQPYGILHGGASVVLAETLGSCAAAGCVPPGHRVVGLDINANHIRGATEGWVTGTARPVHVGRTTQVWQIDLVNDAGETTCVSRITMAVLAPRS
jgi:1,4-dihydroxy-2-naphthoyl-CoA hydrolase